MKLFKLLNIRVGFRVPLSAPGEMYGCITTGAFHPLTPESWGMVKDVF